MKVLWECTVTFLRMRKFCSSLFRFHSKYAFLEVLKHILLDELFKINANIVSLEACMVQCFNGYCHLGWIGAACDVEYLRVTEPISALFQGNFAFMNIANNINLSLINVKPK